MARLLLSLAVLLLVACGKEEAPIRIGINPWPGYEFLFLAKTKGIFEQEGVSVALIEFSSLGDVRRAFERGQIDGMATTLIEVIQASERSDRTPRVILVTDFSNGGDVIITRESVKDVSDLKGKRVAAELAALNMFMLARALDGAELGLGDVEIVPMDPAYMARAYANGEIDAVVTYPPVSLEILEQAGNHVIFSSADIPGEVVDVVSLAPDIVENRRADVASIIRAWDRALDYATAHPDEAHGIMAAREGISVEKFRGALEGLALTTSQEQASMFANGGQIDQAIRNLGDVLRQTGQIKNPASPAAMFDRRPIGTVAGT